MKRIAAGIAVIGLLGGASVGHAAVGDVSAALKVGQSSVSAFDDFSGISVDEGTAIGFNVGYAFAEFWSAEFEYVSGSADVTGPAATLDVDLSSISAYAAFRSDGPLYFVGRVGFSSFELSSDIVGDTDDTGLSFGLGGGYRLAPNVSVEIDYTRVEEDTSWFMLSARYGF